jgi:HEAT repeat protein
MLKLSIFLSLPYVLLLGIANPANAEITGGYYLGVYPPINTNCPQKDFEQYVQQIEQYSKKTSSNYIFINDWVWKSISYCGVKALPILREAFKADKELREHVMFALSGIGKEGKEALPEVIQSLKQGSYFAISTAGHMGIYAKSAIPVLLENLTDKTDYYNQFIIAEALGQIGETRIAMSILLDLLKNIPPKKVNLAEEIAFALVKLSKTSPEVVPALIDILKNSRNGLARSSAAIALGALKEKASGAVPYLNKMLKSEKDSLILTNTALALLSIGEKSEEISVVTTTSIINQETQFRDREWTGYRHQISERQLLVVRLLGDRMNNSIPTLVSMLKKKGVNGANAKDRIGLQKRIIETLAEIGSAAKDSTPVLMDYVQSQNSELSLSAIEAIGAIGSSAKIGIPTLKEVLKEQIKVDNSSGFRMFQFEERQIIALEALGRIGEVSIAVPSLLNFLQVDLQTIVVLKPKRVSYKLFTLRRAGKALNRIGMPAVPYLIADLQSTSPHKKLRSVYGLLQIESLPKEAIDLLSSVVRDEKLDLDIRRLAAYSLERSNIDVQWFFNQYNLTPASKAVCRHSDDWFDNYIGQCLAPPKNGGASLFDQIKKIFGG